MISYRKIKLEEKQQLKELIDTILGNLERKEFFVPFTEEELEDILISKLKEMDYEYAVITVHPDNIASNKATEYTGAKIIKTTNLGDYLRNIYLLKV